MYGIQVEKVDLKLLIWKGSLHEWIHMQQRTKERIGMQTKQVVAQLKIITQVWLQ